MGRFGSSMPIRRRRRKELKGLLNRLFPKLYNTMRAYYYKILYLCTELSTRMWHKSHKEQEWLDEWRMSDRWTHPNDIFLFPIPLLVRT